MATLFRSLFGHKKSHSKGEDDNGNEPNLDRDTSSRRSHRSTSSSRAVRGARFRDDSMLPPTAAYHTQNTTRVRRGPKSCPGEYVDEDEPVPSRSFNVDTFRHQEPRDHHRRRSNNNMMPSSSMTSSRPGHYSRWETSEYGSENTSPIGYHRHQHRRHQDEEDEEEEEEEEVYVQTNRYQEVKRKIRQHYEERLFNQSQKIKELEKEKSDLVTMLIQLNQKSEKDKKRIEYFKRKWQESETQKMQAAGGFGFGFQTPQYQPMFQFPTGGGQQQQQRYSFMGAQMHPISSTNTPTTSAMDTTNGGGAGESLIPPTDMSFMAHLSSSLPPLELPQIPVSTCNTSGTQQPSNSLFHDDEDEDETKNFREEMEVPRGSLNTLANEEEDEEFMDAANETLLIEGQDSGFSTTPDDASKAEQAKKP